MLVGTSVDAAIGPYGPVTGVAESANKLQMRPLVTTHCACLAVAAEVLHEVVALDLSAQYEITQESAGAVTAGASFVVVLATSVAAVKLTGAVVSTPE